MNSQPDQDEVKFAKALVNPEKSIRDKTLATFKKYVASVSSLEQMEMLKIWKALYYCMWLSDKQPIQAELAQSLCDLMDHFTTQQLSLLYLRMFFRIMMREWPYLDQYRVNKFYTLVRKMYNKALSVAHKAGWTSDVANAILNIIDEEALTKKPNGIRFHLADIFLPELHNVTGGDISSSDFLAALRPMHASLLRLDDNAAFLERLGKEVFGKFASKYAAENATRDNKEGSNNDGEGEEEQDAVTVFPRVNTQVVQKLLFDTAAAEDTPNPSRKRLYDLHKLLAARTGVAFVSQSVEELLAAEQGGKKTSATPGKKSKTNGKEAATPAAAAAKTAVPAEAKTATPAAGRDTDKKKKEKRSRSEMEDTTEETIPAAAVPAIPTSSKKAAPAAPAAAEADAEEAVDAEAQRRKEMRDKKDRKKAEMQEKAQAKQQAKQTESGSTAKEGKEGTKEGKQDKEGAASSSNKAAKLAPGSTPSSSTPSTKEQPKQEQPKQEQQAPPPTFIASSKFAGRKPGYFFQKVRTLCDVSCAMYMRISMIHSNACVAHICCTAPYSRLFVCYYLMYSYRRASRGWATTGMPCRPAPQPGRRWVPLQLAATAAPTIRSSSSHNWERKRRPLSFSECIFACNVLV